MTSRRHSLLLILFVAGAASASGKKAAPVSPAAAEDFVRRSCRAASYPRVCERSLVPRAPAVGRSPRRLAQAALDVAADRARSCSAYIGGPPPRPPAPASTGAGAGAMADCAEMVRDAEEQLRQSAAEMARMGRASTPRFAWKLSNVQTWASAALTDTSTCLDSLAAARPDVQRRVVAVAQATSNALALVNQLQPKRHRQ